MNENIIKELQEIKELLQVIVINKEQDLNDRAELNDKNSCFKFWIEYWKDFIPTLILGIAVGCTLYPLIEDLWRWLIT